MAKKDECPKICGSAGLVEREDTLTPEVLVRKYASLVLGFCLAHTKNTHDAEDAMQDVFLKALIKLDSLRNCDRVRSWLLQIARRVCIDRYRTAFRSKIIQEDKAASSERNVEETRRLHGAIYKLPEKYRETISLYYLEGRKSNSVAESLGISEMAVRRRLVRARLMLHDLLSEEKP